MRGKGGRRQEGEKEIEKKEEEGKTLKSGVFDIR